jgi:uncharacterized membrane protein
MAMHTHMIKKTMTYSVMHMSVAFLVAFAISGSLQMATAISLVEPLVQTFFYFFHEKVWTRISSRNIPQRT